MSLMEASVSTEKEVSQLPRRDDGAPSEARVAADRVEAVLEPWGGGGEGYSRLSVCDDYTCSETNIVIFLSFNYGVFLRLCASSQAAVWIVCTRTGLQSLHFMSNTEQTHTSTLGGTHPNFTIYFSHLN